MPNTKELLRGLGTTAIALLLCVRPASSEGLNPDFGSSLISIAENDFVNLTLWFNTLTDKDASVVYRMEVLTRRSDGIFEYDGRFVLWNNSCVITYNNTLNCTSPDGPTLLHRKVNRSHVEIEWTSSWKDTGSQEFTILKKAQKLNVLYPPRVKGLFVNEQEVRHVSYVDEGQEVKIKCTFDQGNPPASFYLLDEKGENLTVKKGPGHITHIFEADRSKLFWTIRCECSEPTLNASVTVRIRDWPRVTLLSVNGQEANDLLITDEDQHINITCFYDKGNPPASAFHLLDEQRQYLNGGYYEGYVTHLLSPPDCFQRYEKRVCCEGIGSQQNKSVTFLAKCPPRFAMGPLILVNFSKEDHLTFDIKSHTTKIKGCYLISPELPNEPARQVNCELIGTPPHLKMTLRMPEEGLVYPGNWMLTVANEKGHDTTSVIFRLSEPYAKAEDVNDALIAALTVSLSVFLGMFVGISYVWYRRRLKMFLLRVSWRHCSVPKITSDTSQCLLSDSVQRL